MWIPPCGGDLASQAVCQAAQGYPLEPISQTGTDDPENNVIGYRTGGHFYYRTSTSKLYVFGGTVGTAVGWQILN